MQPILDTLNAFRRQHGHLCGVIGLAAGALARASAGDWQHAIELAIAAFGLHHVGGQEPPEEPPPLPFRPAA